MYGVEPTGKEVFFLPPNQHWAEQQARMHHVETLFMYGEFAMFVLMWRAADFEAGLVERCSRCYASSRYSEAFGQPEQNKCPSCFGTTYEGGYRARIIRPCLWTDRVTETSSTPRGEITTDAVTIETTPDFSLRNGDYVLRANGTRYQCDEMSVLVMRTGFDQPDDAQSLAGSIAQARLEDVSSVVYTIPPTDPAVLDTILRGSAQGRHLVPDVSQHEEIRGPLLV